jgi:GNAT superfamily N-acetyltransferase
VTRGAAAVRHAIPADAPLIAAMIAEHGAEEGAEVTGTPKDYAAGLAAGAFSCLIAEGPGGPLGLAMFYATFSSWSGRHGLFLEDLYVRPSARGAGVARRLLAEIARIASARDADRLDLVVQDGNAARRFYARLGVEELPSWRLARARRPLLQRLRDEA